MDHSTPLILTSSTSNSKMRGQIGEDEPPTPSDIDERGDRKLKKLNKHDIDMINEDWEDTEETSMMWEIISNGMIREFIGLITEAPELVHIRSADGRGPMWWAHEYNRPKMIDVMKKLGVSEERKDVNGIRPLDL